MSPTLSPLVADCFAIASCDTRSCNRRNVPSERRSWPSAKLVSEEISCTTTASIACRCNLLEFAAGSRRRNPALRGAGPEAGATGLCPDQSYSVTARAVLARCAGFFLPRKNWDRFRALGLGVTNATTAATRFWSRPSSLESCSPRDRIPCAYTRMYPIPLALTAQ